MLNTSWRVSNGSGRFSTSAVFVELTGRTGKAASGQVGASPTATYAKQVRAKNSSRAWISEKYRSDGVAPSVTQPCLASVQPVIITARCTVCSAAMMAAWPAPKDPPAITVFDHFGTGSMPLRSMNPSQPSPGNVDDRYTSSLFNRFSMLPARLTLTVVDFSCPLRISIRTSIAQFGGAVDASTPFPHPIGGAIATGASLR